MNSTPYSRLKTSTTQRRYILEDLSENVKPIQSSANCSISTQVQNTRTGVFWGPNLCKYKRGNRSSETGKHEIIVAVVVKKNGHRRS